MSIQFPVSHRQLQMLVITVLLEFLKKSFHLLQRLLLSSGIRRVVKSLPEVMIDKVFDRSTERTIDLTLDTPGGVTGKITIDKR